MKGPHNADGINEVMLNNIKQVTWFLLPLSSEEPALLLPEKPDLVWRDRTQRR